MSLLEVKNLRIAFSTDSGTVRAVSGVDFTIEEGDILGLVGETGAGKTTTACGIMRLIPSPPGRIEEGEVLYQGEDLLKKSEREMRKIRGNEISMIFQDPMTALNPVKTIGEQIAEGILLHNPISRGDARDAAIDMLKMVGITEERYDEYPFQFSGGMKQRVVIAMALACKPKLLIADEPTTALDVTTQAQVMELLLSVVKQYKTSLIVVTHNLGLVSRYAKRIYVMYAGRVVECGTTEDLLTRPKHPYTMGLLKAVPGLDDDKEKDLVPIHGAPPNLARLPEGCYFMPRCPYACDKCRNSNYPEFKEVGERGHFAACHLDIKEGGE